MLRRNTFISSQVKVYCAGSDAPTQPEEDWERKLTEQGSQKVQGFSPCQEVPCIWDMALFSLTYMCTMLSLI